MIFPQFWLPLICSSGIVSYFLILFPMPKAIIMMMIIIIIIIIIIIMT